MSDLSDYKQLVSEPYQKKLLARIAVLETALRFYADEGNYEDWIRETPLTVHLPVVMDKGETARKALGVTSGL